MDKKSFLWKMFLFLLLFFTISEMVNIIFISSVLVYSIDYRIDSNYSQRKDLFHTLVVGDSHSGWAVYPKVLDGTFVMWSGDESYIYTYYRLLQIINDEKSKIKLVILPIDLHTFSSYHNNRLMNDVYWKKYIDYWELGAYKGDLLTNMNKRFQGEFAYINGIGGLHDVIKIKTGEQILPILTDGHRTTNGNFSLDMNAKATTRYRVRRHFHNQEVLDEDIIYYFFRTLDLLHSYDIDIVLVKYPISKKYFYFSTEYIDSDSYYRNITQLIVNNGYDLPILDYHDLFWNELHYFDDAEHLNINGAKVFTPIIREDLIELGVYPPK